MSSPSSGCTFFGVYVHERGKVSKISFANVCISEMRAHIRDFTFMHKQTHGTTEKYHRACKCLCIFVCVCAIAHGPEQ